MGANKSTMSGAVVASGSPNKVREKQARNDAVNNKLQVLDQRLMRAQISEEDKLKPLHERINRLQEELAAERLSREVMDERKSKEIKAVENNCTVDLTVEKRARKDLETAIMKQVDETCF